VKLKSLSIRTTKVSDLSPLIGLTNLTSLYVQEAPVSEEQIASLQRALPQCKVWSDYSTGSITAIASP
jgi:Leucine-rich repeat (LRR) protein